MRVVSSLITLVVVFWACTTSRPSVTSEANTINVGDREYIVELQPWVTDQKHFADSVSVLLHGRVGWIYQIFKGFSITLPSDSAAAVLRKMVEVKSMDLSTVQHLSGG